jgi:hypothetical protein
LRACLDHVAAQGRVGATRLGEMRGAVTRVEKIIRAGDEHRPATMPIDLPVAHRISPHRWSNIRAAITGLLIECGWVSDTARSSAPLAGAWAGLMARARNHSFASPLPPFARYCCARHLAPQEVTVSTLGSYEAWRLHQTLSANPLEGRPHRCIACGLRHGTGGPSRPVASSRSPEPPTWS